MIVSKLRGNILFCTVDFPETHSSLICLRFLHLQTQEKCLLSSVCSELSFGVSSPLMRIPIASSLSVSVHVHPFMCLTQLMKLSRDARSNKANLRLPSPCPSHTSSGLIRTIPPAGKAVRDSGNSDLRSLAASQKMNNNQTTPLRVGLDGSSHSWVLWKKELSHP